jgi:malonate transporter and related proteins
MNTALVLLPDFALILFGIAIRRWMHLGDHFWRGVEKLVYFVLFPALLVNAILKTPLKLATALPLVLAALAALFAAFLLALPARRLFNLRPVVFASTCQCAFRFNSYIGLAAVGMLFGPPGVATIGLIIGAAVPLANLLAVWMLARHGEVGIWREIARNPLIWATAAGFALSTLGWVPPAPLQSILGRLADAAVALGLLAVGAALQFTRAPGHLAAFAWLLGVKLIAKPIVAWLIGRTFGLEGLYLHVLVLFAALPTASSAYILAVRMGGDGPAVAWLISASTLLSMLSLPLWAGFVLS